MVGRAGQASWPVLELYNTEWALSMGGSRTDSSSRPSERTLLSMDFWPPQLEDNKFLLFKPPGLR